MEAVEAMRRSVSAVVCALGASALLWGCGVGRPAPTAEPGETLAGGQSPRPAGEVGPSRVVTETAASTRQAVSAFRGDEALGWVEYQVALGPRIPGTAAHWEVGEWIVARLAEAGWRTEVQPFTWNGLELRNLVGQTGPMDRAPIVLAAHYDTRPVADRDPEEPTLPVPGANDGGSGVAVLIELARTVDVEALQQPVWLVFFDAEDGGSLPGGEWIVGARYFADHLEVHPAAVVVVDMVGDADLQLYYELGSDPELSAAIWALGARLGFSAFIPEAMYGILDDHAPFVERGITAIDIIDFDYPYWHTTHDTPDKVSAESLEQVGRTLEVWLESGAPLTP
jgi:glutaminyl-peptide cyclotransferase